ncbi:MAG TPA: DEAD/DEAH box helicase family protein, partial [Blastocatellia bacterium]|nr:DEAD/DEAH box helicase family protein [Blastocatellia bacterium]
MDSDEILRTELQKAHAECERLRRENADLRLRLGEHPADCAPIVAASSVDQYNTRQKAAVTADSRPELKVSFFKSLFRGRDDVYAVRWEGRNGRTGYSPAGIREWNRAPSVGPGKKRTVTHSKLFPLTEEVIRDHLLGRQTIGVYPLLQDDTCWFVAVDFDKRTWEADARAFSETCSGLAVSAALERSRSGSGAHVWLFFANPIPAALARRLASALLTRTMQRRYSLGLDSYDRLFPSQDTMPKGGFGNLIALPLQRAPREMGNSVFIDHQLRPYEDQWAFLSSIRRLTGYEIQTLIRVVIPTGDIIGVRRSSFEDADAGAAWNLPPSGYSPTQIINEALPTRVSIQRGNMIYIEKKGLPASFLDRLIRLAAFQNPEFYSAQSMRLSTFGKPRVIACAEEFSDHIALPRGLLRELLDLFEEYDIAAEVSDHRLAGASIETQFHGELRPLQKEAARAFAAFDDGILCAPTAFGKTAVAAHLIATRKVNTLVLVHRRQLMDQWRERLALFLGLSINEIGQIGGGKTSRTERIDIAVIQSLVRKGEVKDLVAEYGQVIVDECHHVSAFTFERVLRKVKAKFVVGLTATPIRKDGHHPIILMQCGPIRFNVSGKKQAATSNIRHEVIPRFTEFEVPPEWADISIQDIYAALIKDDQRNELIVSDVLRAVEDGRVPLVLTERTDHVQLFVDRLSRRVPNVFVMKGGMGKKQRDALASQIKAVPEDQQRVLIATGRYIGEGFDDARLDTLFLAMPISWRGTLQQYVGRLHRLHENKHVVRVYDYVDACVPVLNRMYEKRLKAYTVVGYTVTRPSSNQEAQADLRFAEIEHIAVQAATAFEETRGWKVESVENDTRGFDLISRRRLGDTSRESTETRFIEVKGRAGVGEIALTANEYKTAQSLGDDYWLYV